MTNRTFIIGIIATNLVFAGIWWLSSRPPRTEKPVLPESAQTLSDKSEQRDMYAFMYGKEFDKAYLADMLAHHQGALNMASRARFFSTTPDILMLSESILSFQSDEVRQMLKWQQEWGFLDGSDPHAGHAMEGGTVSENMAQMEAKLDGLSGNEYDEEFLRQMTLHHQQAIDMSRHAATNAERQEIKDFARVIMNTRESEMAEMKKWPQEWGY